MNKYITRSVAIFSEFQNTLPNDLWNTLDEQLNDTDRSRLPSNTNLSEVMRSWVETPGYPILNVQRAQWAVIISQEVNI